MSSTATPEELLVRARDALSDLASEKKALEEKCASLEQSLSKSAASESALSSALAAARAENESTQNVLEDRERETLALRDLVTSLREHLRTTKAELDEKRMVASHADERSIAADLAKAKYETEEAKLRDTLGQWLNAVYGKFSRLVRNTSSHSLSSSISMSTLPPPPEDLEKALSWLDHLPDVSESFKMATAATTAHLEAKFAEALGACGMLSTRLDAMEREERRSINAMMAVMDSANRSKEETESVSAALIDEVQRLKTSLTEAEALCVELDTNNKHLHRLKNEAEIASKMHLEAKEGMERGVLELQHAWQARDNGMKNQIAILEKEIAERERESQAHASRAAIISRRLEHVQNVAIPTQARVLYTGELERVTKLVRSAESISRGLRTHFERVHQFFKVHNASSATSEPSWLSESRTEMIKELNAALFIAETADAATNSLARSVSERVESAIEQSVQAHRSADNDASSPSSSSSSSSPPYTSHNDITPISQAPPTQPIYTSTPSLFSISNQHSSHLFLHPSTTTPSSSSSLSSSQQHRRKVSGMAAFVKGGGEDHHK